MLVADGRPRDVITTDLIDDVYGAPAKVIRDRRGNVFVLAQLARDARPSPTVPPLSGDAHDDHLLRTR